MLLANQNIAYHFPVSAPSKARRASEVALLQRALVLRLINGASS